MMTKTKKVTTTSSNSRNTNIFFYLYLVLYTLLSTLTLTMFPRVHSDEIWLGSLSYHMLKSKSLFTTEPFFDLFPRTPHTMKILFHSLQQLPIRLFGLSIFNIRLVSLIASILTLIVLYKLLRHILNNPLYALLLTIFTSVSIPFLYVSHFARQEIILVFVLTLCYYLYVKKTNYAVILVPLIIGIAISIHPNAFIIAAMIGLFMLKDLICGAIKPRVLIWYVGILAFFASGNILVSLYQTPDFFKEYLAYGKTLSVNAAPVSRLMNFKDFYIKCYNQISGTYYIPPMKLFLGSTLVFMFLGLMLIFLNRIVKKPAIKSLNDHVVNSLLMIIGFNIGLFIIGRYNTTSIIFLLIPSLILISTVSLSLLQQFPIKKNTYIVLTISVLIVLSSFESYTIISQSKYADYSHYEKEIQSSLTHESIVLGNLSSGFVFKDLAFKDIRNLEYLGQESLYNYLVNNSINTIVYYEEYDYIHRNQNWEILYGDDELYYDELNQILLDYGTLIYAFEDMNYGTRIMRYMGEYPWKVSIYQLDFQKQPVLQ